MTTDKNKQIAITYIADEIGKIRDWIVENQYKMSFHELEEKIRPSISELAVYSHQANIPFYYDAYSLVSDYVDDSYYESSYSYLESNCY